MGDGDTDQISFISQVCVCPCCSLTLLNRTGRFTDVASFGRFRLAGFGLRSHLRRSVADEILTKNLDELQMISCDNEWDYYNKGRESSRFMVAPGYRL